MSSFITLNGIMVVQLKDMGELSIKNFVITKVYVNYQ
jgi:hypothetical protein